jgi:AraC-like DNA-binding protein
MQNHTEIINREHFEKQYLFMPPHAGCADVVDCYWQLDLRDKTLPDNDFSDRIFANLQTSIVFNLGSRFEMIDTATNRQNELNKSIVIGHHTHTLQYRHYAGNFLFGIKLKPAGFNKLFGISSAELNNQYAETELFFRDLYIEERLFECNSFEERGTLMNTVMLGVLGSSKQNHKIISVHKALTNVVLQNRIYNVEQLATSLNLTKRTLERYFKDEIGLTPKTCLSIIRFREALKHLNSTDGLAYPNDLGYYDLSHFMKDYHKFFSKTDLLP